MKDLLEDKNSADTFDAMRYQANYHGENKVCIGDGMDLNDNFPSSMEYVVDKSLENSEVLMSNGDVKHIYGMEERLYTECGDPMMSYESSVITYMNGLNHSVIGTKTSSISFGVESQTTKKYEYDDFGKTNDIRDGFGYNGEELDGSGLIYLRARYYNPQLGRFIQIDTYRGEKEQVESQNRYIYTNNNPYKYIDKNGHSFAVGLGILSVITDVVVDVATAAVAAASALTPPLWLVAGVGAIVTVGNFLYHEWDTIQESVARGQQRANETIANILSENDTVTISGGQSSWAGSTTPRPTITMSREQYLKDIACQEIKDIFAQKVAEEADAISKSVAIPTSPSMPDTSAPTWDLDGIKDKVSDLAPSLSRELISSIAETISRGLKRPKNSDKRRHHIVLKKDRDDSCEKARDILISVGIDPLPYQPPRIANIAQSLHGSLHLPGYKKAVYLMLSPAEPVNDIVKKTEIVLSTLSIIRIGLETISNWMLTIF